MTTTAREPESKFTPAPEGLHQAVCCDVWDSWSITSRFHGGPVEKTRICWQIDQLNPETGKPFEVSQVYTLSLHEKATLCKHLVAWRGRPFTLEERAGFDLERLLGANCQLQIVHTLSADKKLYANVQAIVPLGKSMTKIRVTEDYVRRKDRAPKAEGRTADDAAPFVATDDDVPF